MTHSSGSGLAGLIALSALLSFSDIHLVCAADKTPFTWSKYSAKNGKEYNHPRWNDVGGGKRELVPGAQGTLSFAQAPPLTKVKKVYRHAAQGGWNGTPAIDYEQTPAPTYYPFPISGWLLSGSDSNVPKLQFDEGEEIKIAWEITTTQNGVPTVSVVESIITVEYHAW